MYDKAVKAARTIWGSDSSRTFRAGSWVAAFGAFSAYQYKNNQKQSVEEQTKTKKFTQ